ncbi:50S ribosome-binding GTPase [Candidatus Woesearchaeota archaeon]|nr:50S ribosome-binding GTPase [Candidatus Woesearchaeota archaeon]
MANYWQIVNNVIKSSDILLEVLDARLIEESRNIEIEEKVRKAGKPLIFIINKCDLVAKEKLDAAKRGLKPCAFISAKEHLGTSYLREEIMKRAPKGSFRVGVLGYPNTGKSSVINLLKGKTAAPTSPISGFTKSFQLIRVNRRMYLLDTPGVFPYREDDEGKHAMIAAKTFSSLKDPEGAAMELIERFPGLIEGHYGVRHSDDPEKVLRMIAIKLNKLKRGGIPETNSAARAVLQDWQKGKIKR